MRISRLRTIWYRIVAAAVVTAVPIVVVISTLAMPAGAQTSSFGDVPDDAYFATPVADLHAEGVFDDTLCDEGFCPGVPIDRRTMAVWTIRVLDGQDPSAITQSRFDDVDPSSYHAPFIERLAELRVTRGCGDPSRFCPDRNVTRAEMAAFLSRAFNLLDGANPGFDDVPDGAWYASDVAKLAASGITVGCGANRFCPDRNVTRAETATFLWRATRGDPGAEGLVDVELEPVPGRTPSRESIINLRPLTLTVYYCGTNRSFNLNAELQNFRTQLATFYRRQSGYSPGTNGIARGTDIVFEAGSILPLDDLIASSANITVAAWSASGRLSPCEEKAVELAGNRRVLILADIPTDGISGYAWVGEGPALVATYNRRVSDGHEYTDYLATVAHEIGHAFYGWRHPWHKLELDFDHKDSRNHETYAYELAALMSWPWLEFGRKHELLGTGDDAAYISCRQRASKNWVTSDSENCALPLPPTQPAPPDTDAGDSEIRVSWNQPADNGNRITDYDVRYYAEDGDQWTIWQPSGTSTSVRTTISGLRNGVTYYVSVRAKNNHGPSEWSNYSVATPQATGIPTPRVILRPGASAQGELGADGPCTSVHCRWLNVEIIDFAQEPTTLVCAHNGIAEAGFGPGAYKSVPVTNWPAEDSCLFGYPGSEVFVIVDPELRDGRWHGGVRSNVVEWPFANVGGEVRITWGSDAGDRSNCPSNTDCRNLSYEYIGDWGSPPYSVECWGNGRRTFGPFQWSGRPHTGCYYWGGTAEVVINGIRSNTITFPEVDDDDLELRISWGTDAGDRSNCPSNTDCRNLSYEYIGDWGSQPYSVECWGNGRRTFGPFQWSGRPHTGCYYWGGTAEVVINGIRSNTITFPEVDDDDLELRISWGTDAGDRSNCPSNTDCRNLSYEYIGDWGSPPYSVECWGNGRRTFGPFQWSGRPHTGCYYWGGTAEVVINGIRSNTITFPEVDDDDLELRISWGTDAGDRSNCPSNTDCRNLSYEYIGDWGSPPYSVECWGNGRRTFGPFQWSGRPHTGCYYWGGTAEVVINGIRSNTITFPEVDDDDLELRISWGTDAGDRSNCPSNTDCRNLSYEYIGDWGSPPYSVECWGNGRRTFGPFQWSGRPHTGCYYWGGTAEVVINGIRSNTITFPGG